MWNSFASEGAVYWVGFILGCFVSGLTLGQIFSNKNQLENFPAITELVIILLIGGVVGNLFKNIQTHRPTLDTRGIKDDPFVIYVVLALYSLPTALLGIPFVVAIAFFIPTALVIVVLTATVLYYTGFTKEFPYKMEQAKEAYTISMVEKAGLTSSADAAQLPTDFITAYKFATLLYVNDQICFQPVTHNGSTYKVEDIAGCGGRNRAHDGVVPAENCHCGFYGMVSVEHLVQERPSDANNKFVILECDFYGKVIPGTQGWRAQRQRVLKVSYSPYCQLCCQQNRHKLYPSKSTPAISSGFGMEGASREIISVCTAHKAECSKTWSLQELMSELGTEVAWQEPFELS